VARLIASASIIEAVGTKPKIIREWVGRVNTDTSNVSIAHMSSPEGWTEPGQTPEFDEYTLVLSGCLRVETNDAVLDVKAGQAVHCLPGEWIRYSSPFEGGADYVAICLPAFSPGTVHRDE